MAARRKPVMIRSCRVYLNDLNPGKAVCLQAFLISVPRGASGFC